MWKFSLVGGVGNQLFIAHAALHAKEVLGHEVKLFRPQVAKGDTSHNSWLGDFKPLSEELTGTPLAFQNPMESAMYLLRRSVFNLELSISGGQIGEISKIWRPENPGFVEMPDVKTLIAQGYFASHRYRSSLPSPPEISIRNPSDWLLEKEASGFHRAFPVAWHLRRGDFVGLSESFGVLADDYYFSATDEHGLESMPVAIYTDSPELIDPQMVERLRGRGFQIVPKPPAASDSEAMELMSRHSNIILANSSFSFWAGIMAESRGGKVVRPSKVFKGMADPNEFYPDRWLVSKSVFI